MELRKALLSITAIVIAVLFMGMAMQPATTHSNERTFTVSVKQQVEYDRYFIQKPVNASDQFSNAFVSWYLNREHANPYVGGKVSAFRMPSQSQVKELFPIFLKQNPDAVKLLNQLTAQEKAKFATQDNLVHKEFISMLQNGKLKGKDQYVMQTSNSKYLFVKIDSSSPTPPSNVLNNPGVYEMVSINYFTYTISFWISIATVTYGEQDNFNTIYSGLPAQNHYNKVTFANGITAALQASVKGALVGVAIGGPIGLVAGVIVGAAIAMVDDVVLNSEWKTIYESTYSGNAPGSQYIWTILVNDYFYPWVNPLTTMSSYFYFFGYLKGKGQQTIFPDLPTLVVYSQYLSDGANSFIGSHGQNNLIYQRY